jgi:hypothetical protein
MPDELTVSPTQLRYLADLVHGADMRKWNGWRHRRTRSVCERLGLVAHVPCLGHGGRRWNLTDAGRALVSEDSPK